MKTEKIKSIYTKRYSIVMHQSSHSGLYYLEYGKSNDDEETSTMSEGIKDLNTALHAFDAKRVEFEGQ